MQQETQQETQQERALEKVRRIYGRSAFTEDHLSYRRVGAMGKDGEIVSAIGNTWSEAIRKLRNKV